MPTPEEDKGVVTNFGVSKNTEGGKKAVVDRTA